MFFLFFEFLSMHSLGEVHTTTTCTIFLHSRVYQSATRLGTVWLHFRATIFDLDYVEDDVNVGGGNASLRSA